MKYNFFPQNYTETQMRGLKQRGFSGPAASQSESSRVLIAMFVSVFLIYLYDRLNRRSKIVRKPDPEYQET